MTHKFCFRVACALISYSLHHYDAREVANLKLHFRYIGFSPATDHILGKCYKDKTALRLNFQENRVSTTYHRSMKWAGILVLSRMLNLERIDYLSQHLFQ